MEHFSTVGPNCSSMVAWECRLHNLIIKSKSPKIEVRKAFQNIFSRVWLVKGAILDEMERYLDYNLNGGEYSLSCSTCAVKITFFQIYKYPLLHSFQPFHILWLKWSKLIVGSYTCRTNLYNLIL